MRYDAVFWDIGGVLVDLQSIRDGYEAFLSEIADRYNLEYKSALKTWNEALGDHFQSRDGTEYRSARMGYRAATSALFDGDEPDEDVWWPLFEQATTEAIKSEPGSVEAVEALDETGHYLGVISDIDDREAENMLEAFNLYGRFDHITTSEAVGFTKPNPRIFEEALDAWGGDPTTGLMVGDRYRHDIAGAKEMGLDTVAYGDEAGGKRADYEVDNLRRVVEIASGD